MTVIAPGVVHNIWRNIPNEFDDYIANPKAMDISHFIRVIGPQGKILEVQIRTEQMHIGAEYVFAPTGNTSPTNRSIDQHATRAPRALASGDRMAVGSRATAAG